MSTSTIHEIARRLLTAGDTVDGTQLTDTEGGDEGTDAALLDASVTVSGIGGIQLIAVADPIKIGMGLNEVLSSEFV